MEHLLEKDASVLKPIRALAAALKNRGEAPKAMAKMVGKKRLSKGAWEGMRRKSMESGDSGSILAYLPQVAAEKLIGKEKVRGALWKNVHAPAIKADMAIGHQLSKIPLVGKKMFRIEEDVPWGKLNSKGESTLHRKITRPSALGPLVKTRDLAEPILVGVGTERALSHLKKMKDERDKNKSKGPEAMEKSDILEKAASTLIHLRDENRNHEKRAHATRILYKEIEMGLAMPPGNFQEFEEKIASLLTEDLSVLERALEVTPARHALGDVGVSSYSAAQTAEQQFINALTDND